MNKIKILIPKKSFISVVWNRRLMAAAVFFSILSASCSHKPARLSVLMTPIKGTSMSQNRIKVAIDCPRDDLLRIKLTIANRGEDTISVDHSNILLRIDFSDNAIQAVKDYKTHMNARHEVAKKNCGCAVDYVRCRQDVGRLYQSVHETSPFQFGTIAPGREKSGYTAFNPADFDWMQEVGKCVADSLKSKTKQVFCTIEVIISTFSKKQYFVFPVNVVVYSVSDQKRVAIVR